jgi:DNA-binding transcriptional ArsR family regulator
MVEHSTVANRTLDAAYGALASDVRRAIVQQLVEHERRVTDLADPFHMSLQAVSKHIRVLEAAGLVQRRVDGRTHWLSLNPAPLTAAAAWISSTRTFWEGRLDTLEDVLAEGDR